MFRLAMFLFQDRAFVDIGKHKIAELLDRFIVIGIPYDVLPALGAFDDVVDENIQDLRRLRPQPVNLVINDAGGLSVLTSWAAGKFSGNSISKFFKENVEDKVKSRKVIIPGKVAVLKGDIESKLPGWEVIVAPLEAVQLVKFMKDLQANGEL